MAAVDNGAAEVFDLDALERETTHEPFEFQTAGHTFTLADPQSLTWHQQKQLDSNDAEAIFEVLLGDQYDEFDELDLEAWRLEKLLVAWARHHGIELGELAASSSSSKRTARPSKRTSGRTTASGSRTSRRGG